MKKTKVNKLELCMKLCLFVGYPKETKGGFFYSSKENKVFVLTNVRFLEDEHIKNHRMNNKVVLKKLETNEIGGPTEDQNDEIIVGQPVVRNETPQIEERLISLCRSVRVLRQLDRYMRIEKALVAIFDDNKR